MSRGIRGRSSDGLYNLIKALVSSLQLSQQTKGRVRSGAARRLAAPGPDVEEGNQNVPNLTEVSFD